MKLFSSFKEIANQYVLPQIITGSAQEYYAHLCDHKLPETLKEHVEKVNTWFLKISETHEIDSVVDRLIHPLIIDCEKIEYKTEVGNYIKELFLNAIVFHDYGKINPNFQVEKMKNNAFTPEKSPYGSQHSAISTYAYINFFFKKLLDNSILSEKEKEACYAMPFLFGSSVFRHHSSNFRLKGKYEDDILLLYHYLKNFNIDLPEELSKNYMLSFEYAFEPFLNILHTKNYFSFYALLKLNYSLLTASDYYATNEFMNDLTLKNFGIMDNNFKQSIIHNFQSYRYNKELFERREYYAKIPFDTLQNRSKNNLNQLRQKLTAEIIDSVRKNSDKYLFYLEAPTGAGKTNLSLAFATELLKIDKLLSKIFYVFPFTTLITQTFSSIKETLGITNMDIIQLHSKAGFHSKKENTDGEYGSELMDYIDNLFVNYPIVLLTHIKFFDIIKGKSKDVNYILHRLSNSIVIIDEIQSYNPKHWDKVIYFFANYAKTFNIKILIMSATLPKIDELDENTKGEMVALNSHRNEYFLNPNFKDRVEFNFELLKWSKPKSEDERQKYLIELSTFIYEKTEEYAIYNNGKVHGLIEFISKKTASTFYSITLQNKFFAEYSVCLISGDILESRRKEIIEEIKNDLNEKILVISTQVIEAGVDIDMDLGFKDRSLIDSDEQLAGRINRNSSKANCKVYLFDFDPTFWIYKNDYRYKEMGRNAEIFNNYEKILVEKQFDTLYYKVIKSILKRNSDAFNQAGTYFNYLKKLDFDKIDYEFRLIEQDVNSSVFIPLSIPSKYFTQDDILFLADLGVFENIPGQIEGDQVYQLYIKLIINEESGFIKKQIDKKKIAGIMSLYTISIFENQKKKLMEYSNVELNKYGYLYLSHWKMCYSYISGFDMKKIKEDVFL
ncbi:MAG: CRISPR-associated helicase Cas3' [Bacteroidales bacterium]|nr:CRISPR-associated helicase Cas3' [Bacteroidales bacterium]